MNLTSVTGIAGRLFRKGWLAGLLAAIALGTAIGSTAAPQAADAASITWRFVNETDGTAAIRFFSRARNWIWPGRNQSYRLPATGQVYRKTISCRYGEKICYGGWLRGNRRLYWGVGPFGRNSCANCCYRCTDHVTPVRRLGY